MEQTRELWNAKSRRILVEEIDLSGMENSGTLRPVYLGAKSLEGREPVDRLKMKWVGFNEKDGGIRQGDDLNDQDKLYE